MRDSLIQKHFANLRQIRNWFRIDPRVDRGTGQIAPWLSGIVGLTHPAIPGAANFYTRENRLFPNPAVGLNFITIVPLNEAWRVHTFRFRLLSDAGGIDRFVQIALQDSVPNTYFQLAALADHPASFQADYNWALGIGYERSDVQGAGGRTGGFPEVILEPLDQLRTSISNMAPGDQISSPRIVVEVFPR